MSAPPLIRAFYSRIWNDGDLAAASELLSDSFSFRGSLGDERIGRDAFTDYVQSVRGALADYRCEIVDCLTEGNKAFAKMRFSGLHVAPFRGFKPTMKPVHWLGSALFTFDGEVISDLWVLGDLVGLDAVLRANAAADSK